MDPKPKSIHPAEKYALTPEEKNTARVFEQLSVLEPRDRFMLMLVWKNLKTASPVSLSENVTENEIRDFEDKLSASGMHFQPGPLIREPMRGLRPGRIYFVANNAEDLTKISALWWGDHEQDERVYREIGRMSGFPESAIEAYHKLKDLSGTEREVMIKKLFLTPEEKKALVPEDLYPFSTLFYMSRENWQNELDRVRQWTEAMRKTMPDLWRKHGANNRT